jgi:hypothetical protein
MNKKLIVTLFSVFLLFSNCNFLLPQDSDRVFLPKSTMLKKGSWALTFELGTIFGTKNSYIEAYNFTLKKHISDDFAIRLSLGTYISKAEGNDNEFNPYINSNRDYSINTDYYNFLSSVNFQYFLVKEGATKVFFSLGPYGDYTYQKNLSYDSLKSEDWNLGLFGSVGAELFFFKNFSFIGEYIMKATYGKHVYKYIRSSESTFVDDKVYSTTFNTFRIGFSLYF